MKIIPSKEFVKNVKRLDKFEREKLEKQIRKIIENSEIGKPLKYGRGERCLYIRPFRLIYVVKEGDLILLKFEYRKSVYE